MQVLHEEKQVWSQAMFLPLFRVRKKRKTTEWWGLEVNPVAHVCSHSWYLCIQTRELSETRHFWTALPRVFRPQSAKLRYTGAWTLCRAMQPEVSLVGPSTPVNLSPVILRAFRCFALQKEFWKKPCCRSQSDEPLRCHAVLITKWALLDVKPWFRVPVLLGPKWEDWMGKLKLESWWDMKDLNQKELTISPLPLTITKKRTWSPIHDFQSHTCRTLILVSRSNPSARSRARSSSSSNVAIVVAIVVEQKGVVIIWRLLW